jgi:hypothetical protein
VGAKRMLFGSKVLGKALMKLPKKLHEKNVTIPKRLKKKITGNRVITKTIQTNRLDPDVSCRETTQITKRMPVITIVAVLFLVKINHQEKSPKYQT